MLMRPAVGGRPRSRCLAAADPAPPAGAARRARLRRQRRHRARVHRLPRLLRGGLAKHFRDLEPANLYNVDYSLLGTARVEPLPARIRNEMAAAGMRVENSKGECNLGQHEINFRYADALRAADDHAIYKNGAKEIAAQEGTRSPSWRSSTSARATRATSTARCGARAAPPSPPSRRCSSTSSPASSPAWREMTLFFAPHVNSYKRFAPGSFAPTAIAWGRDNRTCSLRVVGHGEGLRVENRLPGADVNPYLALSALIAAGPAWDRKRAAARAGLRGRRLQIGRPASPTTSTTPAPPSPPARSPPRRSARRSSTTT